MCKILEVPLQRLISNTNNVHECKALNFWKIWFHTIKEAVKVPKIQSVKQIMKYNIELTLLKKTRNPTQKCNQWWPWVKNITQI